MSSSFWHDSLLMDAGWILTKEEYRSIVVFDRKLLEILSTDDPDGIWHTIENEDEGFIQQGYLGTKAAHAISMKHGKMVNSDVIVHLGDLLIHLDTIHRIKWKPYFKYTDSKINIAEKLLFPQSKEDFQLCAIYWNKRRKDFNDISDLPWLTSGDHDQIQVSPNTCIILRGFYCWMRFINQQ